MKISFAHSQYTSKREFFLGNLIVNISFKLINHKNYISTTNPHNY